MIMAMRDFSAQRMIEDYTNKSYIPAIEAGNKFKANGYEITKSVAQWQSYLAGNWQSINLVNVETPMMEDSPRVGDKIPVTLEVYLGDVSPDDVSVEVIAGNLNSLEQMNNYEPVEAAKNENRGDLKDGHHIYNTEVICKQSGRFGIAARILPRNINLIHNRLPKYIKWW